MKKFYSFITCLLILAMSHSVCAQPSKGGTPPSFTDTITLKSITAVIAPTIDVAQVIAEDALKGGPLWAGRSIPVSYNMLNSGIWTEMPDGSKVWRLKLKSAGAKALALCYDDFYIPKGGKLFIYNENKKQVLGAYTSENNPAEGIFSTEMIQGESLTLEYIAPAIYKTKSLMDVIGTIQGDKITNNTYNPLNADRPSISISTIVYVYRDVPHLAKYDPSKQTGFGTSNACEVNVNCSEGTNWQTEKKGVAEIWLLENGGWGWCSGTLINTTNNSGTPYFLTADHCHGMGTTFATPAEMLQWQFYFNYESSSCANGSDPQSSIKTITGCELKASSPISGGSDFCLVLINGGTAIPQNYNPYYNGWDRTSTAATSGVGIHHPYGDIKKISTFTSTLTSDQWYDGTYTGVLNGHWAGTFATTTNGWGQTEGGSSGSPLFNQNHKVVGTLTGGSTANCSTGSSFDYGKMYFHWDQTAGGATKQLKTWLDPTSAGSSVVNGYDPWAGYPDFYGTPTTVYAGNSVNYTDITNGATTWSWQFEGGYPATSTVKNPQGIVYNQQGTYRVTLTTNTPLSGTQTQEKVGYITVLPGSANIQIWCDDFTTPANWVTSQDASASADAWVINSIGPTGGYKIAKIASTSGGNCALFDSDKLCSTNQWAHITNATGLNCTNYEAVFLKFEEMYRKFYDSTLVYVSSDNFATSTRYVINPDFTDNDLSVNPAIVNLDITSAAAGKSNVKVRFTFKSVKPAMGSLAGCGYAWMVDDVCMEGVLPGHSLPQTDFTANTREIPQGGSVSYTSNSPYATSWSWTFEGGTPGTSTEQNPANITYATQGYYPVTLIATNANGSVTKTKTDYIHVVYDCDYTSGNILDDDDITYYYKPSPATKGYVPGHVFNGTSPTFTPLVTAYADKITMTGIGAGKVKSLAVAVGNADVVGGTTNVRFTVWNDNAGVPGSVLSYRDVAVKDLMAGYFNYIQMPTASVNGTFWVGYQLTYVASLDTFACYFANGGVGKTNTTYCYSGSSWTSMQTMFGKIGSLYIQPEFCLDKPTNTAPDVDFYADKTAIAVGGAVNFTDQSTGGPAATSWAWTLNNGTPSSSTSQNPAGVTFTPAGIYNISHTATNTNGTGSNSKTGYIHVANTVTLVNWNFTDNNATADGGITPNLTAALTNWGAPTAQTYATWASTTKWNDANTAATVAWSVTFTTAGYTNIKLSSKQSAPLATSPANFAVYYAVNGGDFNYLTDVHHMTLNNWTAGVLSDIQMPSDCDNATSIEVVWYKTTDTGPDGTTAVAATSASYIDDIVVTGQPCTSYPTGTGTIAGSATVCQGLTNVLYSVTGISGATYYEWTVPSGATIVSGNYSDSIYVDFAINQAAGDVTVTGWNLCGAGSTFTKAVTFNAVPAAPGTITGNQTVYNGQNGVAYNVGTVSGATSYTWATPSFATIASGGTTNSITTNNACPGTVGNITVHANNGCGAGPESYALQVAIGCTAPVADFTANATEVTAGATVNFTDLSTNVPSSWSWTFTGGTPSSSTVKNPSIVYGTAGVYTVSLTATNGIGSNPITKTGYITVSAAPTTQIVYWNFPSNPDNSTADGGIAANLTKTIATTGAGTATFATAGATTNCASASSFNVGSGSKGWQVNFVTTGYAGMVLSSKMAAGTVDGPRDFSVEYSLNGTTWIAVPNTTINCGSTINNWTNAGSLLTDIPLPSACNNQALVYLRWIMTSNTSIDGGTVAKFGISLIDDIMVKGAPVSAPVASFDGTPTTICQGSSVTFNDNSINLPTSWSWTFAGGTPATSTAQNPTVTYNTAGTYNVSLVATNSSGSSPTFTRTSYITVTTTPAAAGTITGTATVCPGQAGVTYTVPSIARATSYTWAYSGTGATITGFSNSVSVVFAANATAGNLTVKGVNVCGNGTVSANYPISVSAIPDAAGTITGTATVNQGQTGVVYSVGAIANATGYVWSLPIGATITAGSNTNSITVTFSGSAESGNVTVYGTGTCGEGRVSPNFLVTVNVVLAKYINLKVFLEGAYNTGTSLMNTTLNTLGKIPLAQPFNVAPWSYTGTESVASIPANVVDWVLVDLRDATSAANATPATRLSGWPKAYFLKSDGSIVALDGTSLPDIGNPTITNSLFAVVRHRNHIAILSNTGLTDVSGTYTYDFSTSVTQAYGGSAGYKQVKTGVFGMVCGDINADGNIYSTDYTGWVGAFGNTGIYNKADINMDGNVFSTDYTKWVTNFGMTNPVAKGIIILYSSQVPE